jgi:GH15 family glucan-1,4-alpha-glucosidase
MPRDLPVGNGTVLVNFDLNYGLRDIYFPHVGQENHTIGQLCRFGVFVDEQFSWVGEGWSINRKYKPETLVTDVVARNDRLQLELTIHDAVEFHLWVFLRQVTVRDLSGHEREVRLFFHHDFHISENEIGDTCFYDPHTSSVIHYKRDRWFLINTCRVGRDGVEQFACGKAEVQNLEGTWKDAEDGSLSGNPIAQGSVDSCVRVSLSLGAFGSETAHVWICFGTAYEKVTKLNSIVLEKRPEDLLRRTENYWRLWVNKNNTDFQNLPSSIVDLYKRSLLIIATQIDEDGAIIAANDEDTATFSRDTYSYMWPRDGALTTYALTKAGYREMGQRFFDFCLDVIKEDGYLMHKYNPDKTVASSWLPWLRNGETELPIQEDETALVIWSLWEHFQEFKDVQIIKPMYRRLITNAADFLVKFRNPETLLPLPSYDLWEERYGVHLFTVAAVIGGLKAASFFADAFGEQEQRNHYLAVAQEMEKAMIAYMWNADENRFCRMLECTADGYKMDMTVDSANFAIFACGALPPDDPKVVAMMHAIRDRLWVKTSVGGIACYENDYYHQVSQDLANVPGNPWFICTTWFAIWKVAQANTLADLDEAIEIMKWVTERALPSGVLAEQVNPYTNEPISVSPLTWSHASFVTCVMEYLAKRRAILGP